MTEKVPFTEEHVRDYLDRCIQHWRKKKGNDGADLEMCEYYIDAFQSVRMSLFGKVLPLEVLDE